MGFSVFFVFCSTIQLDICRQAWWGSRNDNIAGGHHLHRGSCPLCSRRALVSFSYQRQGCIMHRGCLCNENYPVNNFPGLLDALTPNSKSGCACWANKGRDNPLERTALMPQGGEASGAGGHIF